MAFSVKGTFLEATFVSVGIALLLAAIAALTLFGKARVGALVARSCGMHLEKESAGARAYAGVIPVLRTYRAAAAFAFIAILVATFLTVVLVLDNKVEYNKAISSVSIDGWKQWVFALGTVLGIGAAAGVAAFDFKSDRLQDRHIAAATSAAALLLLAFAAPLLKNGEGWTTMFELKNIVEALAFAGKQLPIVLPAFATLFIVVTLEQRTRLAALDEYEKRISACSAKAKESQSDTKDLIAQAAAPVEVDPLDREAPMTATGVELKNYNANTLCEHLPHMHGRETVAAAEMAALRAHSGVVVEGLGTNAFGATAALLIIGAFMVAFVMRIEMS